MVRNPQQEATRGGERVVQTDGVEKNKAGPDFTSKRWGTVRRRTEGARKWGVTQTRLRQDENTGAKQVYKRRGEGGEGVKPGVQTGGDKTRGETRQGGGGDTQKKKKERESNRRGEKPWKKRHPESSGERWWDRKTGDRWCSKRRTTVWGSPETGEHGTCSVVGGTALISPLGGGIVSFNKKDVGGPEYQEGGRAAREMRLGVPKEEETRLGPFLLVGGGGKRHDLKRSGLRVRGKSKYVP